MNYPTISIDLGGQWHKVLMASYHKLPGNGIIPTTWGKSQTFMSSKYFIYTINT